MEMYIRALILNNRQILNHLLNIGMIHHAERNWEI